MKSLFFVLFALPIISIAGMKSLGGSMHGESLGVDYQQLNNGKYILILNEKTGMDGNKAKFKELQIVDLDLNANEMLAPFNNFKCKSPTVSMIYGVVSKKNAKKEGQFQPLKAWFVNEKEKKISAVQNLKEVTCEWNSDAESDYPF
jgi:hypothetical protein